MSGAAGTRIAYEDDWRWMMGRKARVSAVFLLALAIWVGGVWGDDADRRAASARGSEAKNKKGLLFGAPFSLNIQWSKPPILF